jgi:hypothetical protein
MAAESSSFLFTVVATCYSSVERLEVMLIVIKKTVVVGVVVGEEKINDSNYHIGERCAA